MKPAGLITKREAAAWLRASERTVQRRVDKGELRRIKEGGRVFFLESDLIDYLERQIQATGVAMRVFRQKGCKTWRVRYTVGGRLFDEPLGVRSKEAAESVARETVLNREKELAGILVPKLQRESALAPLSELLEQWIEVGLAPDVTGEAPGGLSQQGNPVSSGIATGGGLPTCRPSSSSAGGSSSGKAG